MTAETIFVIMPFDPKFDGVYGDLIKAPLEDAGYLVSRADDPGEDDMVHENIHDQIVQNLWDADYILADLTCYKPNVIYELGIAHALSKRTIQISQRIDEDIPFDIKSQNVIKYAASGILATDLSRKVLTVVQRSAMNRYTFSNIVDSFVRSSGRAIITDPSTRPDLTAGES